MKRIHPEDRKLITALARKMGEGQTRVELKLPSFHADAVCPEDWRMVWNCPAIPWGASADDYDGEVSQTGALIPESGKFWIDVQVASKSRWSSDYEPIDWFTAEFSDGRLISLNGGDIGR